MVSSNHSFSNATLVSRRVPYLKTYSEEMPPLKTLVKTHSPPKRKAAGGFVCKGINFQVFLAVSFRLVKTTEKNIPSRDCCSWKRRWCVLGENVQLHEKMTSWNNEISTRCCTQQTYTIPSDHSSDTSTCPYRLIGFFLLFSKAFKDYGWWKKSCTSWGW